MQLNTSEVLVGLDGKALQDGESELTVGKALANVLVNSGESIDPLKSYVLARKFIDAQGELELDASDVSFLKSAIEKFNGYIVLVKGQLLEKFV